MKESNTHLLYTMYLLWAGAADYHLCAFGDIKEHRKADHAGNSYHLRYCQRREPFPADSRAIHDEVRQLADTTNELLAQVGRQNWAKDHISVMSTLLQSSDRVETAVQFSFISWL